MLNDVRFEKYFELLCLRGAEFNLTTILEREEVWVKHFEDSLAALPFIEAGAAVLDVGSGAGFPGLPLKIARDDISLTLVESVGKKAGFLTEVVGALGLRDVTVVNSRVEDLPRGERFDCGTARAVAKMATLAEYILPFVKVGGTMIAYKAKDAEQEAKEAEPAIKTLGGQIQTIQTKQLAGMTRSLIIIKKTQKTPEKYPRGGNKPRRTPVGGAY